MVLFVVLFTKSREKSQSGNWLSRWFHSVSRLYHLMTLSFISCADFSAEFLILISRCQPVPPLGALIGIPNVTCPNRTYITFSKLAFPTVFNNWQCQSEFCGPKNLKWFLTLDFFCIPHIHTYIYIYRSANARKWLYPSSIHWKGLETMSN